MRNYDDYLDSAMHDHFDPDPGDLIDHAYDIKKEQEMLDDHYAEQNRRWMVEQADTEGNWYRVGEKFTSRADAVEKAAWMDCPARVVEVQV